jgi:hypothetical protein
VPAVAVDELAGARDDDVRLVARVRLLRVPAARRVNLYEQAAVLKHLREARAARPGQQRERLSDGRAAPP